MGRGIRDGGKGRWNGGGGGGGGGGWGWGVRVHGVVAALVVRAVWLMLANVSMPAVRSSLDYIRTSRGHTINMTTMAAENK